MSETTFIVVPAYNEARVIGGVIAELRTAWPNVVVVDDGSTDDTASIARRAGATVLVHVINRGQGAALQTGIAYALQRGAEIIVTFDSDGQHRPSDIDALVEPIVAGRADAVLGSRFLGTTENMPRLRRLVLRLAILFTRITSRARVTDAHNGLRAFSRDAAAKLDIRLDRMAHASEIHDQIVARRLRYVEVPVHVQYSSYSIGKGQSNSGAVRVLWDYFWRRWMR